LDERNLVVTYNDVDFCLRLLDLGYRNIWTPLAVLYHHESASRGFADTVEKRAQFRNELQFMRDRWGERLQQDPAYNPNCTLHHKDGGLAAVPRLDPW
jgi:O-antigen biosynthesis protein